VISDTNSDALGILDPRTDRRYPISSSKKKKKNGGKEKRLESKMTRDKAKER
jgi:hypothetical protein